MLTMRRMAGKKKNPNDRHKNKPFQLRLHGALRQQLEKLAERNASKLTTEISIAIRTHLQANELWPPPAD